MDIVALTDAHLDDALVLNNDNVPDVNELSMDELVSLSADSIIAKAAVVDGAFAGFCLIFGPGIAYGSVNYQYFSARHGDFAYLDRIAVAPFARRLGVGRALYAAVIDELTGTTPVLCCEVNVRPRNDVSLAFHARLGFVEVGQQDTDGGSKTVSLLELPLG
jgi:uncharacterized protein